MHCDPITRATAATGMSDEYSNTRWHATTIRSGIAHNPISVQGTVNIAPPVQVRAQEGVRGIWPIERHQYISTCTHRCRYCGWFGDQR